MRRLSQIVIFSIFCLFFFSCAIAVLVDPLNEVNVPVSDRSPQQLQKALETAFSTALIRMSGNLQIMTLPAIHSADTNVSQWVQSYSYVTQPDNPTSLQLQVTLDQSALKDLLENAGQVFWHRDRPLTLIYLQTADPSLLKTLQTNAQTMTAALGAPIIFPEMDLSDQNIIGNLDQNTLFSDTQLQQLSQRYDVLSVLDGQVSQQPDQTWRGNWLYWFNGQTSILTTTGITSDKVVAAALNNMTRIMTGQPAQNIEADQSGDNADGTTTPTIVTLEVTGVNDISDYAKITHYLKQVGGVTAVNVKDMNPASMVLQINLKEGLASFQQALAADGQLKPIDDNLKPADHAADLYYSR